MKYFSLIFLLLFSLNTHADIYTNQDQNGVVFSDLPMSQDAKVVEDSEIDTNSPNSTADDNNTENKNPDKNNDNTPVTTEIKVEKEIPHQKYTVFSLLSPTDQETIQNQPSLGVQLAIDPALQNGDKVQVYIDDKPAGQPADSNLIQLDIPERGIHKISAKLLDQNNKVLKETTSNTFYVHQAHIPTSTPARIIRNGI